MIKHLALWDKISEKIAIIAEKECVNVISLPSGGRGFILSLVEANYQKHTKDKDTISISLDIWHGEITQKILSEKIRNLLNDKFQGKSKSSELESVIREILESKKRILIILDHFERLKGYPQTMSLLEAIREMDHLNIRLILGSDVSTAINTEDYKTSGLLTKLNRIFIPSLNENETNDLINILQDHFGWKVPKEFYKDIYSLSGGNPGLIKYILKHIYTTNNISLNKLLADEEIRYKLERIQKSLSLKSSIELNNPKNTILSVLIETRACNKNKQLKSSLLQEYIKQNDISDASVPESKLSAQEFKLLELFKSKPKQIITLDEIAKALWGEHAERRYSQWAIYKQISKLNNKLKATGQKIVNIKTRGYRLEKT